MLEQELPKRPKRTSTLRSKTGCHDCRRRRVKCDEGKPSCQQCIRLRLSCRYRDDSDNVLPTAPDPLTKAVAINTAFKYAIPFQMPGSQADRKAMHYFCNFAALDLAGYRPEGFWDRYILQRCQVNSVARQAVVTLSNAHLEHCTPGNASKQSLMDYQKALKRLRTYIGKPDPNVAVVLLCCIVFFAFEMLHGNEAAAALHLQNGSAIMLKAQGTSELPDGPTRRTHPGAFCREDDIQNLSSIFLQLDVESTMQNLDRGPRLKLTDPMRASMVPPTSLSGRPPRWVFSTPLEFREPFLYLSHSMWVFICQNPQYRHVPISSVPQSVIDDRAALQTGLKEWKSAFNDYKLRHPPPSLKDLAAQTRLDERTAVRVVDAIKSLVVETHYFVVKSLLAESLEDPPNAKPWDRHPGKLLALCSEAVELIAVHKRSQNLGVAGTFSTHWGFADALLGLSHRTAVQEVRKRALELVRRFQQVQEGLTGLTGFLAGAGEPPGDFRLVFELPGH